jgi:hypothetical protein
MSNPADLNAATRERLVERTPNGLREGCLVSDAPNGVRLDSYRSTRLVGN